MLGFMFLSPLKQFSGFGVLMLRLTAGAFLLWSMWSVAPHPERIHAFARYLAGYGFFAPTLSAHLSVAAQVLAGLGFVLGLFTRWAGILCAANFGVALIMVDRFAGVRGALPAACLMAIGVFLAFHGAGRFGLDALLESGADNGRSAGRRDYYRSR